MLSRLPRNAPAWLDRLSAWLEPCEDCFTHEAQRGAFRRYLLGLLSDSRRKSMSAMLERVTDPGTKQGRRSVAVARQYCGTLGKVANCQMAVTAALWTGVRGLAAPARGRRSGGRPAEHR